MDETLRTKIHGWIKEAWEEANSNALPTLLDQRMAADLAIRAEWMVLTMRDPTGMTWEQAWSESAEDIPAETHGALQALVPHLDTLRWVFIALAGRAVAI